MRPLEDIENRITILMHRHKVLEREVAGLKVEIDSLITAYQTELDTLREELCTTTNSGEALRMKGAALDQVDQLIKPSSCGGPAPNADINGLRTTR